MVYLTTDGRPAANELAIPTTYAKFASVLAGTVDSYALPVEVRFAFATVITHLMYRALPARIAMERRFETVRTMSSQQGVTPRLIPL